MSNMTLTPIPAKFWAEMSLEEFKELCERDAFTQEQSARLDKMLADDAKAKPKRKAKRTK